MPSLRFLAASSLTLRNAAILAGGLASALIITGCGLGTPDTSTLSTLNVGFAGIVHGGPNPIVGATVKLYATGSSNPGTTPNAYGLGHVLAEANAVPSTGGDTDANGGFSFSSATYTCPAKQFAYIVASGGNPGAGTNNASVLVAMVGRCEDLTPSTNVYINELTTIAAGYALGHFANVTGSQSAGTLNVGIGAPDTANSQTYTSGGVSAGCVSNSFYTTAACPVTSTAALYHAVLNAQTLMPTTAYQPSAPTGLATPGTTAKPPVVPFLLLNSLGNVLVSCVNSTGNCSDLFAATTLPGGSAPTNTFQAMVNLAANPTLAGTTNPATSVAYSPTDFLALASPVTSVYAPALSSAPPDFSVVVYYPTGSGATTGFIGPQYPYSIGVDINDIAYVGNQSASSGGTTNIVAYASTGTLLSFTPDSSTYSKAFGVTPDALGHVYSCDNASASLNCLQYTSNAGALTGPNSVVPASSTAGSPIFAAVDRQNNFWYITSTNTAAAFNLHELPVGTLTATDVLLTNDATTGGADANAKPSGIAIDPDQNIWVVNNTSADIGSITILPNTGTAASPTYVPTSAFSFSLGATSYGSYGVAIGGPSATNWAAYITNEPSSAAPPAGTGSISSLTPVMPTLSGATVTGVTVGTALPAFSSTASILYYSTVDGDGNVYTIDQAPSPVKDLTVTSYGATSNVFLRPCAASSPTASGCTNPISAPRGVAIDSTGSVWIVGGNGHDLIQFIGLGAPSAALLSLGLTGRP